jgi:hypothetical protein
MSGKVESAYPPVMPKADSLQRANQFGQEVLSELKLPAVACLILTFRRMAMPYYTIIKLKAKHTLHPHSKVIN